MYGERECYPIVTKFPSEIIILWNSSALSDKTFANIPIFPFQCVMSIYPDISWITIACTDRFMYIDRLISVSTLNTFCKHNIVHLCMFNHQHTVGHLYDNSIAPFNLRNKVIIITTFNSYWYCHFHCYSYDNFHKIISSLPLRNHYHYYQYSHHYNCNIIMTEGCCYQLIVTYRLHIVSRNLASIVSDTGA